MKRFVKLRSLSFVCGGIGATLGVLYERKRLQNSNDNRESSVAHLSLPVVSAKSVVPVNPQPVSRSAEIMKYGFPGLDNVRTFDDYVVSYDRRNRTPHWVFEHLTSDKVKPGENVSREGSTFFEDHSMHEFFRATNEDYRGSGYDRGHLAAAANHRWSQRALDQTFVLSNISPQVGKGFNRGAWNTLEMFVRKLTKNFRNVYVCSGPLYLPRKESDGKLYVKYEVIGKNHVAVPTHFFKVVLCETDIGDLELLSFLMPNQVIPENIDLKKYLIPLNTVERSAGLILFDGVPKNRLKKINGVQL